jgi:signal transduction histidine kinase
MFNNAGSENIGFGLHIVKKLATNLGGTVSCTSDGERNTGSCFFFSVACKMTKKKMSTCFAIQLIAIEPDKKAKEP